LRSEQQSANNLVGIVEGGCVCRAATDIWVMHPNEAVVRLLNFNECRAWLDSEGAVCVQSAQSFRPVVGAAMSGQLFSGSDFHDGSCGNT